MEDFNFLLEYYNKNMNKGPNNFFGPRDENDWYESAYVIRYDLPANDKLEESQVKNI